MAAVAHSRRSVRSGSLSSDSSSSSDSDGDNRAARMRSAIVQPTEGYKTRASPDREKMDERRKRRSYSPQRSSPVASPRSPAGSPRGRVPRSPRRSPRDGGRRRRRRRSRSRSPPSRGKVEEGGEEPPVKRKKEEVDPLTTRTGGAYIPPARLRMMQEQMTDKTSVAYQRISWEALKKSIHGLVNKVNVSNIANIVRELFQENIVRGRGLLARSLIQAQTASPTFTHVYAALTAIVNTKFPQTGELVAKRLLLQFRKGFRRNDKNVCVSAARFLAHLVNQQILHELVALELLTLLLEEPTDDSVEVAIGFLKECGQKLGQVSPRGANAVYETLRTILHGGMITARVQYMIEVMFAIRKDGFKDHPSVIDELDLVQEDDQITHLLSLADDFDTEDQLLVFHADPDFQANEEKYKTLKSEILGEGGSSSESSGEGSGSDEEEDSEEGEEGEGEGGEGVPDILDKTDSKALALRRQIYLTIMSSLDYEECAHKLIKNLPEGQEYEVAFMLIECCSQERSYLRFYGLLGQRFCQLNQAWVEQFDNTFQQQYATVHRLETNKIRNVAKFFGQLFYMDALPWTAMSCIHLNEEETNSSSRIFLKILFQELSEFMGIPKLNERLRDPLLAPAFEGLLPRDNPKNTRFAINFFTSIGLGGLTDDLREHLKNAQKLIMAQKQVVSSSDTSSSEDSEDSDSESSSSSGGSSSDAEESSSSSSSEDERNRKRGRVERRSREKHKRKQTESEERSKRRGRRERRDDQPRERRAPDVGDKKAKEKGRRDDRGRQERRREKKDRESEAMEEDRDRREKRRDRRKSRSKERDRSRDKDQRKKGRERH